MRLRGTRNEYTLLFDFHSVHTLEGYTLTVKSPVCVYVRRINTCSRYACSFHLFGSKCIECDACSRQRPLVFFRPKSRRFHVNLVAMKKKKKHFSHAKISFEISYSGDRNLSRALTLWSGTCSQPNEDIKKSFIFVPFIQLCPSKHPFIIRYCHHVCRWSCAFCGPCHSRDWREAMFYIHFSKIQKINWTNKIYSKRLKHAMCICETCNCWS